MPEARVCPFCRESFEGEERCPHHDLALVVPAEIEAEEAAANERVRGRGAVMASAIVAAVSFFFPFFVDSEGARPSMSGLAVSIAGAESLWVSFFVPVVVLGTLASARERRVLRRVRLGLFLAGGIAVAAAGVALVRGIAFADAGGSTLAPGAGAIVLVGALAVMALSSLRLGA